MNCGKPTKKISEIFNNHLREAMQESWFYLKDLIDLLNKTNNLKDFLKAPLLVMADVVGLHPGIQVPR